MTAPKTTKPSPPVRPAPARPPAPNTNRPIDGAMTLRLVVLAEIILLLLYKTVTMIAGS